MKNLADKRKKFLSGKVTVEKKYQYTKEMFETHSHLFEYPQMIKNSPIRKIEINDDGVIFTIQNSGKEIRMSSDARDANSMPLSCINFGAYDEMEEMDMVMKLLGPKDVVFDIGSNIGWYAINILLEKKGAVVYCFEPIKSSFAHLKKNFELNNLKTDKIHNFGLSDENKKVKFYFDVECAMASSMSNLRGSRATLMEECLIKKMDDFAKSIPSLKKLDLIKCDVEGAELLVFKGGIETIRKFKPIIFTEMLRKWSKKFGYHPDDIIKLLGDLGYICHGFSGEKLERIDRVGPKLETTNFFFFHEERHKKIIQGLK